MNPTPILHHYDLSPFGEKVRLAFGHKGITWDSVETPIWPPRPDTVPLTAGYRRSPVLQIGADIYCDTLLIFSELERRYPKPTLYPGGQTGLAAILSWWSDTTTFIAAASIATSIIGDGVPPQFIEDRIAFMKHDFSRAASLRDLEINRQRVAAQMTHLSDMLAHRPFLLGDGVSAADLSAYHTLWFVRTHAGEEADRLLPFEPRILDWMERVAALGHGTRRAMDAQDALRIARDAEPEVAGGVDAGDPSGLSVGDHVHIRTDDANDPIQGTLVAANPRELVIRHENVAVGAVHVHFPRFGYSAVRADIQSDDLTVVAA